MRVFDFEFFLKCIEPIVVEGIPTALRIAFVSFIAGIIIGTIAALIKIYKVPVLKQIVIVYVSVFRGTPLMVQILVFYYGLPIIINNFFRSMNIDFDVNSISSMIYMYIIYSLNVGSYMSENIRAAILSVDKGQLEAGYSIGLSTLQVFRRILAPLAIVVAIPTLGNTFINLIKETSLAFMASIVDIMGKAKILAGSSNKFFEAYIAAAVIYWVLCFAFEIIIKYIEKYAVRHRRKLAD